jgi:hypothetical protein
VTSFTKGKPVHRAYSQRMRIFPTIPGWVGAPTKGGLDLNMAGREEGIRMGRGVGRMKK